MVRLRLGDWCIQVEPSLLGLAAPRCDVERFRSASEEPRALSELRLERVPTLSTGQPLNPRYPTLGRYQVEGALIRIACTQSVLAAELGLRAAFLLATLRQGGVLLHASSVAFGGKALVAVGPSGAGKSTFARLARLAGGALLSDEVVALLPDGRVLGTPFRSDADLGGTAREALLGGLFSLVHASSESLEPLAPSSAVPLLLSQTFRAPEDGLTRAELLQRVAGLASHFPSYRFSFRNAPEAGGYLRRWCEDHAAR
ncbi:potassium transporter TrkH [Archangium violaceum]|uniref:potassium transporter TrkH n=1 Tax=Archangium violaceum TaxID=83451 RepID=UPI00193C6ADF|nr:potassium transporter TrkH [Archangium violaceum]QRK13142.1 potassium transporter TrkH [Archangium violaceum]